MTHNSAELHRLYQALYSEHGLLSSLDATRGQQIAQLQHQLAGVNSELRLTTGDQSIVKANDEAVRLARLTQEQVGTLQPAERHTAGFMRHGREVTQKCNVLAKSILDARAQFLQERASLEARCSIAERVYHNIEQGHTDVNVNEENFLRYRHFARPTAEN